MGLQGEERAPPAERSHPGSQTMPTRIRLGERLPPGIRDMLSEEQLQALNRAMEPPPAAHWVDFQASTRLFRRGVYVRLLIGEERRSRARLRAEQQISLGKTLLLGAIAAWMLVTAAILALAAIAYLVKSFAGVDLMDGDSPLHRYFFD